MKIYTKTGDKGSCALVDGSRVKKNNIRVNCYGTVDELNSWIGLILADLNIYLPEKEHKRITVWLSAIQVDIFIIGTCLATPSNAAIDNSQVVTASQVGQLEKMIDFCQSRTKELQNFILPAGSRLTSSLHCARTVCRRAERLVVELNEIETVSPQILAWLNRMSDLCFALARYVLSLENKPEIYLNYASNTSSLDEVFFK